MLLLFTHTGEKLKEVIVTLETKLKYVIVTPENTFTLAYTSIAAGITANINVTAFDFAQYVVVYQIYCKKLKLQLQFCNIMWLVIADIVWVE